MRCRLILCVFLDERKLQTGVYKVTSNLYPLGYNLFARFLIFPIWYFKCGKCSQEFLQRLKQTWWKQLLVLSVSRPRLIIRQFQKWIIFLIINVFELIKTCEHSLFLGLTYTTPLVVSVIPGYSLPFSTMVCHLIFRGWFSTTTSGFLPK